MPGQAIRQTKKPFFGMVFDRFPIGQFRLPNNPEVRRNVGRLQTEVWREGGTCPSAVLFANLAVSAKHVLSLILLRTVKVCFVVDYYSYSLAGVLQFEREWVALLPGISYYITIPFSIEPHPYFC